MSAGPAQLHPMQLQSIAVKRMSIDVHDPEQAKDFSGDINFTFENGHNPFNRELSTISVGVRASAGAPLDDSNNWEVPFLIEVELFGLFTIDLKEFEERMIEPWARKNAPFLLLPYVREQIYGLAARAGIGELIVPLFVQPQFQPRAAEGPD